MATDTYEVLKDGTTLHKDVRELTNPMTGDVVGYQRGNGKIYLEGEIVKAADVGSLYKDALEDEDHPAHEYVAARLRKVSDEPSEDINRRLGVPFAGYDDMDTDEVVAAMRNLPSATIQAIKRYESSKDEPRSEIADYSIGFGEHPDDRQLAELDVPPAAGGKAVSKITTRNVPEDGPVQHGEGVTGTGEPNAPFGSKKKSAVKAPTATSKRAGRRPRSGAKAKPNGNGEENGGDSGTESDSNE